MTHFQKNLTAFPDILSNYLLLLISLGQALKHTQRACLRLLYHNVYHRILNDFAFSEKFLVMEFYISGQKLLSTLIINWLSLIIVNLTFMWNKPVWRARLNFNQWRCVQNQNIPKVIFLDWNKNDIVYTLPAGQSSSWGRITHFCGNDITRFTTSKYMTFLFLLAILEKKMVHISSVVTTLCNVHILIMSGKYEGFIRRIFDLIHFYYLQSLLLQLRILSFSPWYCHTT